MSAAHRPPFSVPLVSRRAALTLAAAALVGALGGARRARAATGLERRVVLHNTHTRESLVADYWRDGGYRAGVLAEVDHALRDHRTGEVHAIDPTLLDLLWSVAVGCGCDAEYEVISGYRSTSTNAHLHARSEGVSARSLHMDGRAIDVRLVGCSIERLRNQGLQLGRGGVGCYSRERFVHLDTGRVRAWSG